jgi:three-Cys-motif partner protein
VSGSTYPTASDGLPARPSGPWAQEKLMYLERYMEIFNGGMKNNWPHRAFLDLMAGPGRCVDEKSHEEFPGSPVRALTCSTPFTDVLLVEAESGLAAALGQRVGARAQVIVGDCNDPKVIDELRAALGYGRLGLAFADNLGLDVPMSTLAALSHSRRLDLFITFQIGDIKRNLGLALDGKDADRWTAFFGSAGWRDVARTAEKQNLPAGETATRLLDFYSRQLGEIGYPHVTHSQTVMKNSRNVGLYRVILAGKHERAVEFFQKIARIDPSGQRRLW